MFYKSYKVLFAVCVCLQNSPLEVDDEGFVIRADLSQNDILSEGHMTLF